MNSNKLKLRFMFVFVISFLVFVHVPASSAHHNVGTRHVIVKSYKTFIDNDGYLGNSNYNWRWATIWSYSGSSSWLVYNRYSAGAHHSDWTSGSEWRDYVMFDAYLDKNDQVQFIFEDYSHDKILHKIQITILDQPACSVWWVLTFSTTASQYDQGCFSASTITDGPGSGNYQQIVIGVFQGNA